MGIKKILTNILFIYKIGIKFALLNKEKITSAFLLSSAG
jgi:hypothetical protein